jgi:hypothetical protein
MGQSAILVAMEYNEGNGVETAEVCIGLAATYPWRCGRRAGCCLRCSRSGACLAASCMQGGMHQQQAHTPARRGGRGRVNAVPWHARGTRYLGNELPEVGDHGVVCLGRGVLRA